MSTEDEIAAQWEELLETGAVVVEGVDAEGNIVYALDVEVLKEVNPELYHAHMNEVDAAVLGLAEKGLVTLDFSGDEVVVELTEKGEQWAEDILREINST